MKLNESIMKNLNIISEAVYGRVAPDFNAEDGFDSESIDDFVDVFDELIKFCTDFAKAVEEDAWTYQGADEEYLYKAVSLLKEARATLNEMWEKCGCCGYDEIAVAEEEV